MCPDDALLRSGRPSLRQHTGTRRSRKQSRVNSFAYTRQVPEFLASTQPDRPTLTSISTVTQTSDGSPQTPTIQSSFQRSSTPLSPTDLSDDGSSRDSPSSVSPRPQCCSITFELASQSRLWLSATDSGRCRSWSRRIQ